MDTTYCRGASKINLCKSHTSGDGRENRSQSSSFHTAYLGWCAIIVQDCRASSGVADACDT